MRCCEQWQAYLKHGRLSNAPITEECFVKVAGYMAGTRIQRGGADTAWAGRVSLDRLLPGPQVSHGQTGDSASLVVSPGDSPEVVLGGNRLQEEVPEASVVAGAVSNDQQEGEPAGKRARQIGGGALTALEASTTSEKKDADGGSSASASSLGGASPAPAPAAASGQGKPSAEPAAKRAKLAPGKASSGKA